MSILLEAISGIPLANALILICNYLNFCLKIIVAFVRMKSIINNLYTVKLATVEDIFIIVNPTLTFEFHID